MNYDIFGHAASHRGFLSQTKWAVVCLYELNKKDAAKSLRFKFPSCEMVIVLEKGNQKKKIEIC